MKAQNIEITKYTKYLLQNCEGYGYQSNNNVATCSQWANNDSENRTEHNQPT